MQVEACCIQKLFGAAIPTLGTEPLAKMTDGVRVVIEETLTCQHKHIVRLQGHYVRLPGLIEVCAKQVRVAGQRLDSCRSCNKADDLTYVRPFAAAGLGLNEPVKERSELAASRAIPERLVGAGYHPSGVMGIG